MLLCLSVRSVLNESFISDITSQINLFTLLVTQHIQVEPILCS